MLKIGRLRLQVPPAMQHQAGEIARLIGQHLADMPLPEAGHLDSLVLQPQEVAPGAASHEVAAGVTAAIGAAMGNPRGDGRC